MSTVPLIRSVSDKAGLMPLHPSLFAAAFVLTTAFAAEVAPTNFLRSVLIAAGAAAGLVVVARPAVGNWRTAGFVASTVVVVVASRGFLADMLGQLIASTGDTVLSVVLIALLTCCIAGAMAYVGISHHRTAKPSSAEATRVVNVFAILLVSIIVVPHVPQLVGSSRASGLGPTQACEPTPSTDGPDIYLLLLDGYPRRDTLLERFQFDNQPFLQALEQRGFDVAAESRSNYNWTAATIASMLNMRYLDAIPALSEAIGRKGQHVADLRQAAENGEVFAVARQVGLQIAMVPPSWQHVDLRGAADQVWHRGQLNELERDLLLRTWLPELLWLFDDGLFSAQERSRVVDALADVSASASQQAPAFVFAHIPLPHHPILFDADGSAAGPTTMRAFAEDELLRSTDEEFAESYTEQLQFLNQAVLLAVDSILETLATRGREPLIIVMSDHGYDRRAATFDPHLRFSNFFASLTPPHRNFFEETTTPVNVFRRVFDAYFGTCYRDLPDLYFAAPEYNEMLMLQPVADPNARLLSSAR